MRGQGWLTARLTTPYLYSHPKLNSCDPGGVELFDPCGVETCSWGAEYP